MKKSDLVPSNVSSLVEADTASSMMTLMPSLYDQSQLENPTFEIYDL